MKPRNGKENEMHEVIDRLSTRITTAIGGTLTGLGVASDHVNAVLAFLPVLGAVSLDIALGMWKARRKG
ncbi:hypothetical protein [Tortoise microvirus 37]|nr:hypothetical protein [Tortoise microvirus 37]